MTRHYTSLRLPLHLPLPYTSHTDTHTERERERSKIATSDTRPHLCIGWKRFSTFTVRVGHIVLAIINADTAATDNMLDNISAHRDWPVYINIFEHHPSQLNLIVQTGQK